MPAPRGSIEHPARATRDARVLHRCLLHVVLIFLTGETVLQGVGADGLSHGNTPLAAESSKFFSPIGLFTLGSGLYIANWNGVGYIEGGAYRLSPPETPVATSLAGKDLTIAMTGFLLSGSEEGGGSKEGGSEEPETKTGSGGEKGS